MKVLPALLSAALLLTGCEPSPWLREQFDASWYRAIEGRQVVILVDEDNAKVGGCVIELPKKGITLMGRYLDGPANNK